LGKQQKIIAHHDHQTHHGSDNKGGSKMKPSKELTQKICSTIAIVTTLFALFSVNAQAAYTSTAFPIPDSGQNKCYDMEKEIPCPVPGDRFYGQDANYLINPPSYTKLDENGNDLSDDAEHWVMVRDNVSGLIWEVKTDDGSIHDKDNEYTWYDSNPDTNFGNAGTPGYGTDTEDFITNLNTDNFGGFTDWRLASLLELTSIINYGSMQSIIEVNYFPNVTSKFYWSSTSTFFFNDSAWVVDYTYTSASSTTKAKKTTNGVIAVRSGSFADLVINGDETVTDIYAGVMWPRKTFNFKMNWLKGLIACESLVYGGFNDWRLPTINELRPISFPFDKKKFFTNFHQDFYFSSTTSPNSNNDALGCIMNYWAEKENSKYAAYYIRPIRGGQSQLSDNLIIWNPKQGTIWNVNDTIPISWDTKNIPGHVDIFISRQGGKEGTFEIIAEKTENDGKYSWLATGEGSVNCMIKIIPVNEPEKMNKLGLFSIMQPCFFSSISEIMIEDCSRYDLTFTIVGPEKELPDLSVSSSNNSLVPDENIHVNADDLFFTMSIFPIDAKKFGSTTITIEIMGKTCSSKDDIDITILPVNDPPLINIADSAFYTNENVSLKLSDINPSCIVVSDEDAENQPVQVTLCAMNGLLELSQTTSLSLNSGHFIHSDRMSFEGTIENINHSFNHLVFVPLPGYFGHAGIEITTNDHGESGPDGPKTDHAVLHIFINPEQARAIGLPVIDSDTSKCYDDAKQITCPQPGENFYGQDANYSINMPSYTKLDCKGNVLSDSAPKWAMVKDNITGLIWEIKTNDGSIHDKNNTYTWYDSNPVSNEGFAGFSGDGTDTEDFITNLNLDNFGGFSDWRLPSIQEFESIVNSDRNNPSINTNFFPNVISANYWSQTNICDYWPYAVAINFKSGTHFYMDRFHSYYARAVRGGQYQLLDQLIFIDDRVITDVSTGLMWKKNKLDYQMNWKTALKACEDITYEGFDDWRLPSRKELLSLIHNPKIINNYRSLLPALVPGYYWSSSSYVPAPEDAWGVYLFSDTCDHFNKNSTHSVLVVRGGQNRIMDNLFIWSPKQSSVWKKSNLIPITWNTQNISGNVNIFISFKGGKNGTFEPIIHDTKNDGSYEWIANKSVSSNCVIKIEPVDDSSKGSSTGLFTISGIHISPISDININENSTHVITFTVDVSSSTTLTVTALSSNASLLPEDRLNFSQTNTSSVTITALQSNDYTLTINPLSDQWGETFITLFAENSNSESDSNSFQLIVNNPPIISVCSPIMITEGQSQLLTQNHLLITDKRSSPQNILFKILSSPSVGILTLSGSTLTRNESFSQADINANLISYTHNGDEFATRDEFTFIASDGSLYLNETSFVINIELLDDPPTIAHMISKIQIHEDSNEQLIDLTQTFTDLDSPDEDISISILNNSNPSLVIATLIDKVLKLNFQKNQYGEAVITLLAISSGKTVTTSIQVIVNSINDAPILVPDTFIFPVTTEKTLSSDNKWVSDLIGKITENDPDSETGIAVFSSKGLGHWQFQHESDIWTDFEKNIPANHALLIDASTKIHYIPDGNNGELAYFCYYAWDKSVGRMGDVVDISERGGTTAFSTESGMVSITVTSVNDRPVLSATDASLPDITEDDIDNMGISISHMLGDSVSDPDANAYSGIALTGWGGDQFWQYAINSTSVWQALTVVDFENHALLLSANDRVRYVPNGMVGEEKAYIQYVAWDQSDGNIPGSIVDTKEINSSKAFSIHSDTRSICVEELNDAPVLLEKEPVLYTITEEDIDNNGIAISHFINNTTVTDVDINKDSIMGIAIFNFIGRCQLQYFNTSWKANMSWNVVGNVALQHALALSADYKIRCIPDQERHENAAIYFHAWDGPLSDAGRTIPISDTGGTHHFSYNYDVAYIKITEVNDAPELTNKQYLMTPIDEDPEYNPGNTIAEILGDYAITDKDGLPVIAIAVTSVNNTNGIWYYWLLDRWLPFTATYNGNVDLKDQSRLLDSEQKIKFEPDENYYGNAEITFRAWDKSNMTDKTNKPGDIANTQINGMSSAFSVRECSVTINIGPINDPPTLDDISSPIIIAEDAEKQTIVLEGISYGPHNENQTIHLSAETNNQTLIDHINILYESPDTSGSITYSPEPDNYGTAMLIFTVSDGFKSIQKQVEVKVLPVNDPPFFTPGLSQTIKEDAGFQHVQWATGISPGTNETQFVEFKINPISGNGSLIQQDIMISPEGILTYTPIPNMCGSSIYEVYLEEKCESDNCEKHQSTTKTLNITVLCVNDQPDFKIKTEDIINNEDCGEKTYSDWATNINPGENEFDQSKNLSFQVIKNSNTALFQKQPEINAQDGSLTFTPAENAFGSAEISVVLNDGGGNEHNGLETSPQKTFSIHIHDVNDPPSFSIPDKLTINEDAGQQVIDSWATDINKGPENENSQSIEFHTLISDSSFFSQRPIISSSGTLTFTTAKNACGTVTITVLLQDDGGVANGGMDKSEEKTFQLIVNPMDEIKAIIVVGSYQPLDSFKEVTDQAYKTLINIGLTDLDIFFLKSTDTNTTQTNTKSNLNAAITQWANDADQLILYMAGHGIDACYKINETEDLIPSELADWLKDNPAKEQTIIYDACYSGSFISELMRTQNNTKRIIITSSAYDKTAIFRNNNSFSFYFWTALNKGLFLDTAFFEAKNQDNIQDQNAQIEADGLNIGEKFDYLAVDRYCIGHRECVSISYTPCISTGKDSFEDDDSFESARVVNSYRTEMECRNFCDDASDWTMIFSPKKNHPFKISAENPDYLCDPAIEIFDFKDPVKPIVKHDQGCMGENETINWNSPYTGIFYVKISNATLTQYTENTSYLLDIHEETAAIYGGIVTGLVRGNGDRILDDVNISLISPQNTYNCFYRTNGKEAQYYNLETIEGNYAIKAFSEGFQTLTGNIEVKSLSLTTKHIYLSPIGDIDNNGIIDMKDLIICMKIVAGFCDYENLIIFSADIDDNRQIGLAEVIYMMQCLKE
jgi:hypothetical protein